MEQKYNHSPPPLVVSNLSLFFFLFSSAMCCAQSIKLQQDSLSVLPFVGMKDKRSMTMPHDTLLQVNRGMRLS